MSDSVINVRSLLKRRTTKERLKNLCRKKNLSVSGSKNDLIERIIRHYDFFELFDSLNILDILSWDELLYISTLIDREKCRKEILAHPNVRALMEKRYVSKYEKERFSSLRGVAITRKCGIVSLKGKKHSLNEPFKKYFRERIEEITLKKILSRYRCKKEAIREASEDAYEEMLKNLRRKYPLPTGFIGFMGYDINDLYPRKVIDIPHEGEIRILAFSDYRIQRIEHLFRHIAERREKPDIIIYAGDDIQRFNYIPWEVIDARREEFPAKCDLGYFEEFTYPWISVSGRMVKAPIIKFRVPRDRLDSSDIKSAILSRIRQLNALIEVVENSINKCADLKNGIQKANASLKSLGLNLRVRLQEHSYGRYTLHLHDEEFKTCIKKSDLPTTTDTNILVKVIESNDKLVTGYLQFLSTTSNLFEKLALLSKYGLAAIIGNDEHSYVRSMIKGKNVYNVHYTPLRIGKFLILGQEGAVAVERYSPGYVNYREGDVKFHLTLAARAKSPGDKIIIVSHTPPQGILDRAIRFGERSIGSRALRDFIEERSDVALVICGHVHSCGGRSEGLNKALIVNVSSHDDPFSRANIAWIRLKPEGTADVEFEKLPSLVEDILTDKGFTMESKIEALISRAGIPKTHAPAFFDCYVEYGKKFLDAIEDLAYLHFRYGFSWSHLTEMFRHGVTKESDVTEEIISKVANKFSGIERRNLQQFWRRFKSIQAESPYLLDEPVFLESSPIIVFDSEYAVAETNIPVLYGFLNMETDEARSFWKGEEADMIEWLRKNLSENAVIIHYGGDDRKILYNAFLEVSGLREAEKVKGQLYNVLSFFQTSLVSPKLRSVSLENVFDALCGTRIDDPYWRENFYMIDGIIKNGLCHRIVNSNFNDEEAKRRILNANKADLLALKEILTCICNLKVKPPPIPYTQPQQYSAV